VSTAERNELNQDGGEQHPFEDLDSHFLRILPGPGLSCLFPAELIKLLREMLADKGKLFSRIVETRRADGAKFTDYFDFQEEWRKVPSHRALAVFLADRLRSTVATLGYSSNETLDQDKLYRDEIDPETLDAISLAGARFEWIQKKLRSA